MVKSLTDKQKLHLRAKRPSLESSQAMCQVAKDICSVDSNPLKELRSVEEDIKDLTRHNEVKVVNSGNAAILSVMSALNGTILIPDQGGWSGFKEIASLMKLPTLTIDTNQGVIDPEVLMELLNDNRIEAFFLTSLAAYTAEQPLKEIYQICDENNVLLVEDASGALGDPTKKLACAKQAHIILASTGSPKMVNAGSGGFLSTNRADIISDSMKVTKTLRATPVTCAAIRVELKNAGGSFSKTVAACEFLKNEFEMAFHREKRGVNVCLSTKDPRKFAQQLREHIEVAGGGMITTCPRYDRLTEPAVCLEMKNLDLRCLSSEKLEGLVEVVNKLYLD